MRVDRIEGVYAYEASHGLDDRGHSTQIRNPAWPQSRTCFVNNPHVHTLRGMHYQQPFMPKIVTCVQGSVFDVLVDMRPESPTFMKWTELVLCEGGSIWVSAGIAHGYMTLVPNTLLVYVLGGYKNDDCGVRWDDPKLDISWPAQPKVISQRDQEWSHL